MPDVIRVQLTHFKGRRPRQPAFDLDYARTNPDVSTGQDETHAWLNAGRLSVVVSAEGGQWRIDYLRDGKPLTSSEPRAVGLFAQDGETYLRDQLTLDVGETVYGLGERFGAFVKNGQSIDIWNADGGTLSEYAYKNVPFYVTSKGYGVLVNHPGNVSFEVASHHVSRVQFSVEGHSLDYYLFGGPTIKDALDQYTALSGRPALPPEWSFGLWLSTSFTTNYDEATILANIDRMESLGIPISVFHFDCFWMRELTWCSFIWDRRNFPDPAAMLKRIKAKGIKICVWINPVHRRSLAAVRRRRGAGLSCSTTPDGDVWQVDRWQPGMGFVDFTNPAACDVVRGQAQSADRHGRRLLQDRLRRAHPDRRALLRRLRPGADAQLLHLSLQPDGFRPAAREKGEGEAVVFARSATTGGQKFPVHWGGDNMATYPSMAETLRGGLSLGMSGFGYWSHDISGFTDTATPDLYKRWVAFGLLSSHSRLHGSTSARMPWLFDDEAGDVLRFFNDLKKQHDALPAGHGARGSRARHADAAGDGAGIPRRPACRYLDTQYMLGSALLVAPIFSATGEVTYYLPAGEWRNLLTGRSRVRRRMAHRDARL